jgi:hypothetical protein
MRSRILAAVLASWALAASAAAAASSSSSSSSHKHHRSPHVEITAVARVETVPQRTRHANGREFEELDVRVLSEKHAGEGLVVDLDNAVHVVHDLTCGGTWLEADPGDLVEIQGEYVHPPHGGDLIHFTHPASSGACGGGTHIDGYFRAAPPEKQSAASGGEDLFQTTVRPVVARRCLCHEKGGRMYERLPFDDPSVLSSHAAGVRRRLKGDDLAVFEKWMAAVPASSSQ